MKFVGLDIGTTNCKAGLFNEQGEVLRVSKLPTKTFQTSTGEVYYNPEQLWETVKKMLKNVMEVVDDKEIASIGISSMAEAGLLIDKNTGRARSNIIPWYDKRPMKQYEKIKSEIDEKELFKKTGLYPSYKYGLNKILWLKENNPGILNQSKWLSVADFIAYKLTGNIATDYTLAARTYLFRIDKKQWDIDWMRNYGLSEDNFPRTEWSGKIIGKTNCIPGVKDGIPVAISGHDHLCAALAVGAINPGIIFDSMGTAETLIGAMPQYKIGDNEYNSGLSYGCHVVGDRYFWMGNIPASGGSVEWFRKIIGDYSLTYDKVMALLDKLDKGPTGILYYPYLSGSGSPLPDVKARAAFIGLDTNHSTAHLLKAILEGTSFEMEHIRRSAEKILQQEITRVTAVGGGTNNPYWMNIKSNVSGIIFEVLSLPEATLLGAAFIAAVGCGFYKNAYEVVKSINIPVKKRFYPDSKQHSLYCEIYEKAYTKLQSSLRNVYNNSKVGDRADA